MDNIDEDPVSEETAETARQEKETSFPKFPYRKDKTNWSPELVRKRHRFLETLTSKPLPSIGAYSFPASAARGNIENFSGVIQIPMGLAGPLLIDGEHAKGIFYVPLATTEGTLVASASRGMQIINKAGGTTCTVSDDHMQRSPVFEFANARTARFFRDWVMEQIPGIRKISMRYSSHLELLGIQVYLIGRAAHLRLDFTTGDAAGQNMVHGAGYLIQKWIEDKFPEKILSSFLSGNMDTDKKVSAINSLAGRGKHVTAEVTLPVELIQKEMRTTVDRIRRCIRLGQEGSFVSRSMSNCFHAANAVAAVFLATGQDAATIGDCGTAFLQMALVSEREIYLAITLPNLIIGTYGGGTGLPTQRECLEILGCHGKGKVGKLAEIIAATALSLEISLMGAVTAGEWAQSHEKMGRNR